MCVGTRLREANGGTLSATSPKTREFFASPEPKECVGGISSAGRGGEGVARVRFPPVPGRAPNSWAAPSDAPSLLIGAGRCEEPAPESAESQRRAASREAQGDGRAGAAAPPGGDLWTLQPRPPPRAGAAGRRRARRPERCTAASAGPRAGRPSRGPGGGLGEAAGKEAAGGRRPVQHRPTSPLVPPPSEPGRDPRRRKQLAGGRGCSETHWGAAGLRPRDDKRVSRTENEALEGTDAAGGWVWGGR